MNHDDDLDRKLRAWFEGEAAHDAPRRLFDAVVADTGARRPRLGWLAVLRGDAMDGPLTNLSQAGRLLILGAVTAALLVGLLAGAILAGGSTPRLSSVVPAPTPAVAPAPTPTGSPEPTVAAAGSIATPSPGSPGPSGVPDAALEDAGNAVTVSGVTYTSDRFEPRVSFRLDTVGAVMAPYTATDWCPARTSTRAIVIPWKMGCVSDLRILRPYAVDCGIAGAHPDAAALAAAILADPGMGSVQDLGTLQASRFGKVPDRLFLGAYQGRIVEILGTRPFDPSATDPAHCRLLPEPGSGDPTIELRGDMGALFVLLDVRGELVALRVAEGGYDAPTGVAAHARGYGGIDGITWMLSSIHDIQFK